MSEKCPKCTKAVYIPERGPVFNGTFWHKTCFKCQTCSKTLIAGQFKEHQKLPYCETCFNKQFRPKGYGGAGTHTDSYTAAKTEQKAAGDKCKCGVEKKANAKFCGACGEKI